ncbi:hypothetical protein RYX36_032620 [Vicia faba]
MSEQDLKKNHYCILKVNSCICKGCEKKIKKSLLKIQGVESVNIEDGKVVVVGNVNPNELINILKKSGKHAEIYVTHKPKAPEASKNEGKAQGNKGNGNITPSHPRSKGNNGNRNKGHLVPKDPMMNNGGGHHHHHQMMQMPPQQRFMSMPMMNQQSPHMNMFPPMYGMPHPSMMHGMAHPPMIHGMPHPSMMHGMVHPPMIHEMPHPSMMHGLPHPPMHGQF